MRKLITASMLLFLCGSAVAQIETDRFNTYSPYSIFGIGDSRFNMGTAETQGMAGVGASWTPVGVNNLINPASLSNLRQTTYSVGASLDYSRYKDSKYSNDHKDIYFDYLVFSVPLSRRSGLSLGLTPFSATGYSIYERDSVLRDGSYKQKMDYYDGNGGITQIYVSYGHEIFKNFSVGASASYLFGTIKRSTFNYEEDILTQNKITQSNWITGFKFRFGFNYAFPVVKETMFFMGATYDFSANLTNERTFRRYVVADYEDEYDPDNPQNKQKDTSNKFNLPSTITVGIGVGNIKKWYVGLDAQYISKPDYKGVDYYDYDDDDSKIEESDPVNGSAQYQSSMRFALGASYIPMYNSPKSYFERVRYQAGVYYRQSEYKLFGQQINDMGGTLGIALPMTKVTSQAMSISNLNVFVNFGMLGKSTSGVVQTTEAMVKETYFKLGISFSLNDTWFLKQRYY